MGVLNLRNLFNLRMDQEECPQIAQITQIEEKSSELRVRKLQVIPSVVKLCGCNESAKSV
jgi:hypothetical protein